LSGSFSACIHDASRCDGFLHQSFWEKFPNNNLVTAAVYRLSIDFTFLNTTAIKFIFVLKESQHGPAPMDFVSRRQAGAHALVTSTSAGSRSNLRDAFPPVQGASLCCDDSGNAKHLRSRSIGKRLFGTGVPLSPFHIGMTTVANVISRREIANKQELLLGG
jgi:hypothetical protein